MCGHSADPGQGTDGSQVSQPGVGHLPFPDEVARLGHAQWPHVAVDGLDGAAGGPRGDEARYISVLLGGPSKSPTSPFIIYFPSSEIKIHSRQTTLGNRGRCLQRHISKCTAETDRRRWGRIRCPVTFCTRSRTPQAVPRSSPGAAGIAPVTDSCSAAPTGEGQHQAPRKRRLCGLFAIPCVINKAVINLFVCSSLWQVQAVFRDRFLEEGHRVAGEGTVSNTLDTAHRGTFWKGGLAQRHQQGPPPVYLEFLLSVRLCP